MFITVPIAIFGYMLVGPLLFTMLPARRAVIASMIIGTMFLPNASYQVPVLRAFGKSEATVFATLLGVIIFDGSRLSKYRFHWIDIPMVIWCLCPFVSSVTNGLGVYDGLAEIVPNVTLYGLPYLIARLYVWDREGARELAIGMMIGGLVYVPFCLLEMRAGPFFHSKVYGYYPHNWWEQLKAGGWRPSVFFIHGLWLGGFMAYASICALSLWWSKSAIRLWGWPISWFGLLVIVTMLNCKSNGAIAIFVLGAGVVIAARYRKLACALLIMLPLAYTSARVSGLWSGESLVSFYGGKDDQAGGSLNTRRFLEDAIITRAMEQPVFGWGGYGRSLEVMTERGKNAWTEAIWTKAIGERGLIGLWAWMLSGLLPAWIALRHVGREKAIRPADGAIIALIVLVPMHTIYGLVVLDLSPLNPFFSGAAAGLALVYLPLRSARARRPATKGAVVGLMGAMGRHSGSGL